MALSTGTVGESVLHVDAHTNGFTGVEITLELALVFAGHIHDRNREIGGKTEDSRVRQVHALGRETALAADYGDGAGPICGAQKIAKLGEDQVETFFRTALGHHQNDSAAEFVDAGDFFVEIKKIGGDHFGFDAIRGSGTRPAHGIDAEGMMQRFEQFGFGFAARPTFPHGPLLRVDILQADGFHLSEAPVNGFLAGGRASDASADLIAEFGEVIEGVGIHCAFTGDFDEGGERAVLLGALWLGGGVGLQRESRKGDHEEQSQRWNFHPHSP